MDREIVAEAINRLKRDDTRIVRRTEREVIDDMRTVVAAMAEHILFPRLYVDQKEGVVKEL